MSFGAGRDDEALRAAWREFCARLEQAGELAFKDHNPANALQRADAFRFLTQNLGQAFDLALETKDTKHPQLHLFCGPNRKLGADAGDIIYMQAWIDGESVYRVWGNKGTARFLNFTVQGPRPDSAGTLHEPFGDVPEANLFGHQLQAAADGSFELYIGGAQRGSNWLPTTTGSRKLFVRQGFDRWDEVPARLSIERVGMAEPRPLPTPQRMIEAMDWAGRFVTGLMSDWPEHPYRHSPAVDPNSVNRFPEQRANDAADKKRGRAAAHLCWQLAHDEALIVSFDAHAGFWMLTNMGAFFNSMDYFYRPVSFTPSRTTVDRDGKVRLILSAQDPGIHNWIDTQGFERGNLTYRNLLGDASTRFETQLVKHSMLSGALPADTAKVSSEQRIAQMRERFDGIRRRYGI